MNFDLSGPVMPVILCLYDDNSAALPYSALKWRQLYSLCYPHSSNYQQQRSLFIHLVYNGDVKADRESARLPARLDQQSALIFPGDFMSGGRQNSKVKAKFMGHQSKQRMVSLFSSHYIV